MSQFEQTGENSFGTYWRMGADLPLTHYPRHNRVLCLRCGENNCVHAKAFRQFLGIGPDPKRSDEMEIMKPAAQLTVPDALESPELPIQGRKTPSKGAGKGRRKRVA